MNRYRFAGYGRKVGALGLAGPFTCDVEAADEAAARIAVYEQYEHIAGGVDGLRLLAPGGTLTVSEALAMAKDRSR
jgi:hypothetical protein